MALAASGVAADKPQGYAAYKLLWQRNIFDPERQPPKKEETQRERRSETRSSRPPSLRLTGTMVSNERMMAFFSGSSSEFNKVAAAGAKVGDFTVGKIEATQVELTKGDKTYQIGLGQEMTLGDKIEIGAASSASVAPEPPPATTDAGTSATPSTTAAPSDGAAPSNDKSEVLRKMMERRRQEMNK